MLTGVIVATLVPAWRAARTNPSERTAAPVAEAPACQCAPGGSSHGRTTTNLDREIRAHLAMAEAERVAEGADREAAHFAALKDFGNVTLTTEAARRVWTPGWLEGLRDLTSDVRYAVRALARNAGFSLAVITVLAVGIGLNAAVFTLLKSLAFSPLAGVPASADLAVVLNETSTGRQASLLYPDYEYLRDHDQAFAGLIATRNVTVNLGAGLGAEPIIGELVTGNYFQQLGVGAQLGRTLLPSDEIAPGQHPVVVLSDSLGGGRSRAIATSSAGWFG